MKKKKGIEKGSGGESVKKNREEKKKTRLQKWLCGE
jgi:hypothetical protein